MANGFILGSKASKSSNERIDDRRSSLPTGGNAVQEAQGMLLKYLKRLGQPQLSGSQRAKRRDEGMEEDEA